MQTNQSLKDLLLSYISGTISDADRDSLFALFANAKLADEWKLVIRELSAEAQTQAAYNEQDWEQVIQDILHDQQKSVIPVHRIHFLKRFRWAAAAVFVLAMAGTWWFWQNQQPKQSGILLSEVKAPEKNRALIRLNNGQTVYLDSIASGSSLIVDGMMLTKTKDGQIVYSGNTDAVAFNTASNPRGSTVIDLELSDHSHVWLNAGSSITYPVVFNGNERSVTIEGEAYFEVAHDASKPFIVSKGNTHIKVLGTHFNVKAYNNEQEMRVTLLQGKVSVKTKDKVQLLAPEEQAIVQGEIIELNKEVNLGDVMAWKNGFTTFHDADLQEILHELEHWYDITTEMKQKVKMVRTVDVPRNVPLKDVLQSLLDENGVKYTYDAALRKLTILP